MKLCVDCINYSNDLIEYKHSCTRSMLKSKSPVTGETIFGGITLNCNHERLPHPTNCGEDGRFWSDGRDS